MSHSIFVLGATGNTGRPLAQELARRGHNVYGLTRNAAKAPSISGVTWVQGDIQDPDFLTTQLKQVDAAYLMLPPKLDAEDFLAYQARSADAVAAAVRASGLAHAVVLSSQGAHLPSGNGPIASVHYLEKVLRPVESLNAVILRPTYFMENLLASLPLIREHGIMGSPIPPDVPMPMIATQDIAAVAADHLGQLDFSGKPVVDLLGPRNISMNEATAAIGQAIGRPELQYVQFPPADARQGMIQSGLSESLADLYIEMATGNVEEVFFRTERTPENTTPTSLEEFARQFAAVYRAQAEQA